MVDYKKKFLISVLSLQLAFLGLVGLDWSGLGISILRQIIGFFYLTFIPGILFLGILNVRNLDRVELILYSVGLSLSILMFMGFLMNIFLPHLGILRPISEKPLISVLTAIVITFTILFYFFSSEKFIRPLFYKSNDKKIGYSTTLIFALLPLIAVFGAYFLKYYGNNTILLALYALISLVPLLFSLKKFPDEILPFIVWIISISLLFSVSLSSKYLSYGDSTIEYYYANLVYVKGIWNSSIFSNHNAMLRIVMLHPIYSILLDLNLMDEFKIIHPLLYSFTPVALYLAFKRQTNEKIAFLSVFFFMSLFSFYVILSRNTRMGIAEFFLALFILLMTNKYIDHTKKYILSIIFALSIVVSHYGTSYVFMFSLISATILLFLIRLYGYNLKRNLSYISLNFVLIYIAFLFGWYTYTSGGLPFNISVVFLNHMIAQMSELFTPETSYVVYALSREWSLSVKISRDLLLIASIFMGVGIMSLIWDIVRKKKFGFQEDFAMFSISFFGVVLATFLPTIGFNPARVYHLSLCFLAPFSVVGFIKIYEFFRKTKMLKKMFKMSLYNNNIEISLKIFSIFLIIFFLFNSGVISETLIKGNDYSPNILISKPRALSINDTQYVLSFYMNDFSDQEVFSARWLSQVRANSTRIYLDRASISYDSGIFYNLIGPPEISHLYYYVTSKNQVSSGYIFLRTYNVIRDISIVKTLPLTAKKVIEVYPITSSNKIYTNGGSEIYFKG